MAWWKTFFDDDYHRIWGVLRSAEQTAAEVEGLWTLLGVQAGDRVLDAPCGYGRLSRPLAERGARITGVDQSAQLIAQAERERGDLGTDRLRYLRHDLRAPLDEDGFDVAMNVFSSIGYGTEDDDLAIFSTLARAVRPGGLVLVETAHRDLVAAGLSSGRRPGFRLPDGTLLVEDPVFDPVAGRIETCWYWSGPAGAGEKRASLRVYSATELVRLMERAGLRFRSAHAGCSPAPFRAAGTEMGGRLAILAERP